MNDSFIKKITVALCLSVYNLWYGIIFLCYDMLLLCYAISVNKKIWYGMVWYGIGYMVAFLSWTKEFQYFGDFKVWFTG